MKIFQDYVIDFYLKNQLELKVDFQLLLLDADNLAVMF